MSQHMSPPKAMSPFIYVLYTHDFFLDPISLQLILNILLTKPYSLPQTQSQPTNNP